MLRRNSKETVQTFLWMYYIEWRCVDEHILAPAYASLHPPSTSLPSKFQDLALRFPRLSRTTHFPGLSRYWKFYKHNSRTFHEAWESCTRILWINLWAWQDQPVTVVHHPCWLTSRGGGLEGHVARGDSRQCPCKHGHQQEVTGRYSVQTESQHCNWLYVLLVFLIC